MDTRERQRLYKVTRDSDVTRYARIADAFEVSNSAKVIEKGLFAFNANLNTISDDVDQLVVNCLLRFPPEDEIYFSLFVRSEMKALLDRLEEMRAAGTFQPRRCSMGSNEKNETDGVSEAQKPSYSAPATASPDSLDYTNNNKNVKSYIGLDGRLYLRNKSYWDSMPDNLATISKPVVLDKVVFGIYSPCSVCSPQSSYTPVSWLSRKSDWPREGA